MYPFYDENYRGNTFMPMQQTQSMSHMPMTSSNMYQPFQSMAPMSAWKRLLGGFNGMTLKSTIHGASKTIGTINQVIPLVNQARPVFNNAKNAIRIMKAVKQVNTLDIGELQEIDDAITIDEEESRNEQSDTIEIRETKETVLPNEQLFENML